MARFLLHDFGSIRRRCFLAAGWIIGLLLGYGLYLHADENVVSLMRGVLTSPVSIAGLVNVTLLPFLFSAFAVYLGYARFLPVLAAGKAFGFGFVLLCAMDQFGSAGWLACPLLLFSDMGTVVVLWLYWLQASDGAGFSFRALAPYVGAAVLIGSLDYWVIGPFLAGI